MMPFPCARHLHAILREDNEPEVVPVVLGSLGKVLTSAS